MSVTSEIVPAGGDSMGKPSKCSMRFRLTDGGECGDFIDPQLDFPGKCL